MTTSPEIFTRWIVLESNLQFRSSMLYGRRCFIPGGKREKEWWIPHNYLHVHTLCIDIDVLRHFGHSQTVLHFQIWISRTQTLHCTFIERRCVVLLRIIHEDRYIEPDLVRLRRRRYLKRFVLFWCEVPFAMYKCRSKLWFGATVYVCSRSLHPWISLISPNIMAPTSTTTPCVCVHCIWILVVNASPGSQLSLLSTRCFTFHVRLLLQSARRCLLSLSRIRESAACMLNAMHYPKCR